MHVIHGLEPEDDAGQQEGVTELPPPGFAVLAGAVHLVAELLDPTRGVALCGAWLRRPELWRRRPPGQLCMGCFGGEAVAVALRRP